MAKFFIVTPEESNQKIFNYLQRKFILSTSEAHKWIRKGDVRINKKKCQAFDRIEENDEIRVPPFAQLKQENENTAPISNKGKSIPAFDFKIIFENEDLLVIDKPCGIAVQGGSKQDFSIHSALLEKYKEAPFMPTPAHRLDKDTSGLLLIAKSYNYLEKLHKAFHAKDNSDLKKYYIALVEGYFEEDKEVLWEDWLIIKKDKEGREKTFVDNSANKQEAKFAQSKVKVLSHKKDTSSGQDFTLLQIELITGRKHQIRAQCAHRNIPIYGDVKYNGKKACRLYLHAFKLTFGGLEFISYIDF